MDETPDLVEPDEESLPPKPPIPEVEEDFSIPGEEAVPDEEFQSPEDAEGSAESDNNERDFMDEQTTPMPDTPPPGGFPEPTEPTEPPAEGEGEKYDGGEIPGTSSEDNSEGEAVSEDDNPEN